MLAGILADEWFFFTIIKIKATLQNMGFRNFGVRYKFPKSVIILLLIGVQKLNAQNAQNSRIMADGFKTHS